MTMKREESLDAPNQAIPPVIIFSSNVKIILHIK